MELAIPGIALGLMYIMKGQSNNTSEQEESFANQNALPNTDIPNRNYPDEYPVRNEELDRTSALSTVNKFENGGSVYTDKYFNANLVAKREQGSNEQTEFYSLTGEKVGGSYFSHNNMVPFFGAKMRTQGGGPNANEGILDNYTGSGSQTISKKEQAPLFAPNDNQNWASGAPNMNDFYQSRVNKSMRMANTKPFEEERVAPGLGLGYTNDGAHGFNSGMMARESWMPKTADEMRVATNQKSSGHVLLGHEGPAYSSIKNIATQEQMGVMEKNRPDQSFELDTRSMASYSGDRHPNGANSDIGRLFITTGAGKGETLHSIPIDRHVTRPETAVSYSGVAGSQNPSTYVPGEYMPSHNVQLGAVPIAGANANGRNYATDADYGIKSKKAYPNNRTSNTQTGYFGMVGSSIGAVVAPLLDALRPSRKQNVIGNLRPYQNPGTTVPSSYIFNPADRPSATIRETTENSKNHLNVNANQLGGAYQVTDQQSYDTNRQSTSTQYVGGAGAGDGTRQMTSYESGYNQRNNDIKSSTIDGYMVKGNMNMLNSNINMREKKRDDSLRNNRAVAGTMPYQSPDVGNMGRLAGGANSLYSNINMDRNTPDIMDTLKQNPYVVNYKNAL
jgi:hypothetical protein